MHPSLRSRRGAAGEIGRGVVFFEIHLAGQGDALGWSHCRGALARPAIEIGDGGAENIDVRTLQHPAQRVMARRCRAIGKLAELEHVPVEEEH